MGDVGMNILIAIVFGGMGIVGARLWLNIMIKDLKDIKAEVSELEQSLYDSGRILDLAEQGNKLLRAENKELYKKQKSLQFDYEALLEGWHQANDIAIQQIGLRDATKRQLRNRKRVRYK